MNELTVPSSTQGSSNMISIDEVNLMEYEDFMVRFGNIVQAARWITSALWSFRPFISTAELHMCVCKILDGLPLEVKEGTLRGLPDLAGKEAQENKLGPECTKEQRAAGLLNLTRRKRDTIKDYNARYKTKFGFPFVICARKNKVDSILAGLQSRIENSREEEVEIGINEIKKICWYRVCDIISLQDANANVSKL